MRKVIQFLHPGVQPVASLVAGDRKLWSHAPHCRSFIEASGKVLASVNARPEEHDFLRFWGEWEAEADIVQHFPRSDNGADAKMCIRPRVAAPSQFSGHQNTDPFVFDGPFVYCVCQQEKKPSLRCLGQGDLILFGSNLDGGFVVDTVFVVASAEPYSPGFRVPLGLPKSFRATTDWPLSRGVAIGSCTEVTSACVSSHHGLVLYRGASPEAKVDGMFSFVPALVNDGSRSSFRRPELAPEGALSTRVTPAKTQAVKITDASATSEVAEVWREVVKQVQAERLLLGVHFRT